MVHWLMEDAFSSDLGPMKDEIVKQGHKFSDVEYVPFNGSDKYLSLIEDKECIVIYGSLQFAKQAQKSLKSAVPGLYFNQPQFECTYYYPRFAERLLNSSYVMLPFGELIRRKDFLIQTVGQHNGVFVRPSSGFKLFTGKTIWGECWDEEIRRFGFYDVEPEKVVVVAEPRNVIREWRCLVVNDTVICGCEYQPEQIAGLPVHVHEYAQQVVNEVKYRPDPAWILDVCESDGKLHVLEVGCFSCAGLYECSPDLVVRAVSEVAMRDWQEIYGGT